MSAHNWWSDMRVWPLDTCLQPAKRTWGGGPSTTDARGNLSCDFWAFLLGCWAFYCSPLEDWRAFLWSPGLLELFLIQLASIDNWNFQKARLLPNRWFIHDVPFTASLWHLNSILFPLLLLRCFRHIIFVKKAGGLPPWLCVTSYVLCKWRSIK